MALWSWSELVHACGLQQGTIGPDIEGISIDTRSLAAGDLFVALSGNPGPRFHSSSAHARDGHDFVQLAEKAGAAALLLSRDVGCSLPEIRIENTLDGLWHIGEAGRVRMAGKVIGITGSSGKTTARSWLESILRQQAKTHASRDSFNNHWGVPLSLARMPRDTEYGILEIGMNNPGEIEPLSRLVNPDVALILNVLPVHMGNFDSLDAIRQEKLSITRGLKDGGVLVVHEDIDLNGISHKDVLTFGRSESCTVSAEVSVEKNKTGVRVSIRGKKYEFQLIPGGEHRVLTSLGALAVVYALGGDLERACRSLSSLEVPIGRGNLLEISGRFIIDDSYNANPDSMRYALEALYQRQGGRKVALLGEMLELGDGGEQLHASILDACCELDGVITVGEGFANTKTRLGNIHWGHYASAADINPTELAELLHEGDTILVKGSNKVFWVNHFVEALQSALSSRNL